MDDVADDGDEADLSTSPFARSSTDGVVHSMAAKKWSRGSIYQKTTKTRGREDRVTTGPEDQRTRTGRPKGPDDGGLKIYITQNKLPMHS